MAPSVRKTIRLVMALRAIGIALGGTAGIRLAARLRLPTSATTLLRLVQAVPVSDVPTPQAVGVDEWAWRRGHRDGTILVDLATHRVVDLLPDRSAATVAAWLGQHPTITVVCRDRNDLYADSILRGAPKAVQIVDRFHLVHNFRQAAALARFARGLQDDLVAITAGLTLEWSDDVTEGQIHRLKVLKRQGDGRAGFALLRQRVR